MDFDVIAQAAPPQRPWSPGSEVHADALFYLGIVSYVCLAVSILAVMGVGALIVLDKDRGEPVSATAIHMRVLRILVGVICISAAGSLAALIA